MNKFKRNFILLTVSISVIWIAFIVGYRLAFINGLNVNLANIYSQTNYQIGLLDFLNEEQYEKAKNSLQSTVSSGFIDMKSIKEIKNEASLLHFISNPVFKYTYSDYYFFNTTDDDYFKLEEKFQSIQETKGSGEQNKTSIK